MLACADKVEVFALDFIHHCIHFGKAHNACYNVASYHERRYAVGEASVDHEISCVRNDRRMKSCDVAHKIIESVACNASCAVKVDSFKALHNVGMIGNFKIGNNRLAEFFYFNVFAVIFSDGY